MKTIQTIIAASILLASVSASANYDTRTVSETISTNVVATQTEAYQLGINKLSALKLAPEHKLGLDIHVPSSSYEDLRVNDGGYITTQERQSANGQLSYVGMVNFDYSFTDIDD